MQINSIDTPQDSLLLINKPYSWTSFDVVKKVKGILKSKMKTKIKVGHAGTLDPLATGLLIICTGSHTKKADSLLGLEKVYTGQIRIGATTPSYDLETEMENECDISNITEDDIRNTTKLFIGEIDQYPPIFSAKKVDGKKLYEHARKGSDVEIKISKVTIYDFEITNINMPYIDFKVKCSKGTYLRSLAHDFGQKLGVGGHLTALRRTDIGEYSVENSIEITDFQYFFKLNNPETTLL
ncbi:MAG: tRNA pseudouridine(55) synthase TruB [Bacteroidetes bacterium GWE2_29_8]|nr:MAG: tRNA pseudouridine(55) synthase TruB [Bacteroidetes bacterium GWE2_29_8]OFY16479.1 MAG: tRNA pseudouridine(55) synthase TruB [Bacteroidetes bacterium GWF2_29_10]